MSSPQEDSSQWQVAATVSFYIVAALAMVVANKWVLLNIPIPLTFLLLQLLASVLLLALCRTKLVSDLIPAIRFRYSARLELSKIKALLPMVGLNFLGLTFSTLTLKFVDASFYQVARGLILPFTVVISLIFLKTRPSLLALLACFIITIGFLIGIFPSLSAKLQTAGELGFTTNGVIFGLAGSITSALHVVVIKTSLSTVGNSAIDLSWYSNCLTSLCLIPLIVVLGEVEAGLAFLQTATLEQMRAFLVGTAITGLFGFLMSIAGILSVKVTSPITHMVSSAVRSVAQTGLGMWLFGELLTVPRASSVAAILFGSIWYTWIKHTEQQQASIYHPLPQTLSESKSHPDRVNGDVTKTEDLEMGERKTTGQ